MVVQTGYAHLTPCVYTCLIKFNHRGGFKQFAYTRRVNTVEGSHMVPGPTWGAYGPHIGIMWASHGIFGSQKAGEDAEC